MVTLALACAGAPGELKVGASPSPENLDAVLKLPPTSLADGLVAATRGGGNTLRLATRRDAYGRVATQAPGRQVSSMPPSCVLSAFWGFVAVHVIPSDWLAPVIPQPAECDNGCCDGMTTAMVLCNVSGNHLCRGDVSRAPVRSVL